MFKNNKINMQAPF